MLLFSSLLHNKLAHFLLVFAAVLLLILCSSCLGELCSETVLKGRGRWAIKEGATTGSERSRGWRLEGRRGQRWWEGGKMPVRGGPTLGLVWGGGVDWLEGCDSGLCFTHAWLCLLWATSIFFTFTILESVITDTDGKIIKDQSNAFTSGGPSASVSVIIPSQGLGRPLLLLIGNKVP